MIDGFGVAEGGKLIRDERYQLHLGCAEFTASMWHSKGVAVDVLWNLEDRPDASLRTGR